MKIARSFGKIAAVVAVGGTLIGGATAHADAGEDLTSSQNGANFRVASYTYSWQSYGNKNVAIEDKEADRYGVYSLYDRKSASGYRLDNKNGNGTKRYSGSSTSNYVTKVTACINKPYASDICGPDDRPGDGR